MKPNPTSLVTFRELRRSDAQVLFEGAFGNENVTRYLQWDAHNAVDETKSLVEEMVGCHQRGEKYFWLGLSLDDGRPIGLGSLRPEPGTGWIGFLVFHDEQRKGFGSAILSSLEEAVLRSFENASAGVRPENGASISLLELAGWAKDTFGANDSGWLVYRKARSEQAGGVNECSAGAPHS